MVQVYVRPSDPTSKRLAASNQTTVTWPYNVAWLVVYTLLVINSSFIPYLFLCSLLDYSIGYYHSSLLTSLLNSH